MLALAVLPAWAVWASVGHGQAPAPAAPHKINTNKPAFRLPLQVDDKEIPRLQEVQLWVKEGPTAPWIFKDAVPPTQKEFIFRAPHDGEYWFTLVTVDKAGNKNPADLSHEPAGLIVVVEKPPAEPEVRPVSAAAAPAPAAPAAAAPAAPHNAEGAYLPAPTVEVSAAKIAPAPPARAPNPSRQYLNTTHATLNYQIDQKGPSGVGKVEVWMTRDEGQTWQKLCDDPDRHSPVEIDLPGEGHYGLSLVVTNGNGHGGEPPARGESPDWQLEVDTTKPAAQLQPVRPGAGADMGTFLITWTATDKNLKADPIDLFYAAHLEGPWVPIAKGLKNDGSYRWPGPRDLDGDIFVRMDVTDLAGNVATCTTSEPVVLDRSRPKAHVVGVVAGGTEK
jgi:hypothetical protein